MDPLVIVAKLQKLIRETIKEIQLKEAPCVSFVMQNYGMQPPPFNMIGQQNGHVLTCGTNPQFTPLNTPSGGTAYCSTPQLEGCTYTYNTNKSMWFLAKDKGKIQPTVSPNPNPNPNPNPEDFGGGMGHPSGLGHSKGHSNKITKNMSRPGARTKRR